MRRIASVNIGILILLASAALLLGGAICGGWLSVALCVIAVATCTGAALVCLGVAQRWWPVPGIGLMLQVVAGCIALRGDWGLPGKTLDNAELSSIFLLALAGFVTAWLCWRADFARLARIAYLWGLCWWLMGGYCGVGRFVPPQHIVYGWLMCWGITGWLAAECHGAYPNRILSRGLALTTLVGFMMALALAFIQCVESDTYLLQGAGTWVWPLFAVLGARSLWCLREGRHSIVVLTHLTWWILWPTMLELSVAGKVLILPDAGRPDASVWLVLGCSLPWLALIAVSLVRGAWLRWPLQARGDDVFPYNLLLLKIFAGFELSALWFHDFHAAYH